MPALKTVKKTEMKEPLGKKGYGRERIAHLARGPKVKEHH